MMQVHLNYSIIISLLYAAVIYLIMWLASRVFLKGDLFSSNLTAASNRYGSIDGLRGLLAICVLVHHSWYFCQEACQWGHSAFLNQLGKASVIIFFMITGFLFTNKAMVSDISFSRLFYSRFFRLFPLYSIIVSTVIIIVMCNTNWKISTSIFKFIADCVNWYLFVVFGRPDINNFHQTHTIIAGVNWTLKYEVLFYVFCVPVIHFAWRLGGRLAMVAFLLSASVLVSVLRDGVSVNINPCLYYFIAGSLVAAGYSVEEFRPYFSCASIKLCAIISLFALVAYDNSIALSLFCAMAILISVVGGASIFGIMKLAPSRWLGDVSYGIYLIHGIILWAGIKIMTYLNLYDGISAINFFMFIVVITIIVFILASFSYVWIELPLMNIYKRKSSLIHGLRTP